MGKKYRNSPIVEAICEFRLSSDVDWDITFPGLLYERARTKFPEKEQRINIPTVTLENPPQGSPVKQKISSSDRVLFYTRDRKGFIQTGPHLLSVHRLKPYPTWDDYKPDIKFAFEELNRIIENYKLQRIGLRYINKIEIPLKPLELSDYFDFRPHLGENLPQNITSFIVACEKSFQDGKDFCRFQLITKPSEKPDQSEFTLDLDYFVFDKKGLIDINPLDWVEAAHDKVEEIFEGCITDNLRDIFQEVK